MNYNNSTNLIVFLDIDNEENETKIINYEKYQGINCIKYNDSNFFCIFVKEISNNLKTINIKHFNSTKFKFFKGNNVSNDSYITNDTTTDDIISEDNYTGFFIDNYTEIFTDNNSDIENITEDDEKDDEVDNKDPYEINEELSFNLSLINNFAFDFYKTDDNHLITCFLVNEDNSQKIICYKNTFEELINSRLSNYLVYKSCEIKRDNKPEFFNYEKINIIYETNELFKVILYTFDKSKYLIINLNNLISYITSNNYNFLRATISNAKKQIYILNSMYITTKNDIQYLNLLIIKYDTYINTLLEYPVKPSDINSEFFLESELGEAELSLSESLFTLGSYSIQDKHSIKLIDTGIATGTYTYKHIPSSLLFNYKFIIYPQYCLIYTDDAKHCTKCVEGAYFLSDTSLCYSEDSIPAHYYMDTFINSLVKCDNNCYKCNMLKTGGISACVACDDGYDIYRYRCVAGCPEETYTYSYQKTIKTSEIEKLMTINVCNDTCEEEYTGYIFREDINSTIKMLCILNKYKNINDEIEQRLNKFLTFSVDKKIISIFEQKNNILSIANLSSENDFNNLNTEFILLNYYIYRTETVNKRRISTSLSDSCEYYFKLIEDYFLSLGGDLKIVNYNNNENLVYFFSALSSLLNNNELLRKSYFDKLKNYFFKFGENLTDISIDFKNEIGKINVIMNAFVNFINETMDSAVSFVDPNFDQKEFDSNKYYRYQYEILLGENNIKIMNLTNNLYKFLIKSNQDLLYYQNIFISFYNKKLKDINDDEENILYKLGLTLNILGSESKFTTSSFSTNNISDLIETSQISEYKIIIPPLKLINSEINWNTSSFGLIIFKGKYPFLNMNSTSYASSDFLSINFYDNNNNVIKVSNIKEKNEIKIVRKKSKSDIHMGNCVFFDETLKNLNDEGCNSFDLVDYIICTTDHLSDFTISSFSPTYLIKKYNEDKDATAEEKLKNSHFFKDNNLLKKLGLKNAIIIYINITISLLFIALIIIKFLTKPMPTKAEKIVKDSYLRYTMNDDTETDKKVLKYIIEKEIDYILKNRKDYENQKKQEMALEVKNDVFSSNQKVITIIEDDSEDDDDEEVTDKKPKKVSFRETAGKKNQKKNKTNKNHNNSNSSLKRINSIEKKKGKNKNKKKEVSIEMSNIKDENDFIENDDEFMEEPKNYTNKYRYSFNYKNNPRKSNLTNSNTTTNIRNVTYSNNDNNINDEKDNRNINHIAKKQSINERFKKNVKDQISRHIYSILDKTLNEYKSSGQNSLETSNNIVKRPSSMIGISNALNKINNKEEEKILIKNEFFVIFKLILYILFQYEYRPISLFNKIDLPISRNNLIFLLCFRLSLQLSVSIVLSPRYYGDNYNLSSNVIAVIIIIIISDIIYTPIEIILMKKKISTSTDIKTKGIMKFRQIMECLLGYILLIIVFAFGLYNSIWVSLYFKENNIRCGYLSNYVWVILMDYLVYEIILLIIKSIIFTYVVYQDSEGCILKIMEIFNKVFIFYLAE